MACTVMICDDLPEYRSLVRAVLEPLGAEFVEDAVDGRDCIEKVKANRPGMLLLDVGMPGMNGIEALPAIRDVAPETNVVVLTTGRSEEYREPALAAGATGFVEKPKNVMDLPDLLRAALAA